MCHCVWIFMCMCVNVCVYTYMSVCVVYMLHICVVYMLHIVVYVWYICYMYMRLCMYIVEECTHTHSCVLMISHTVAVPTSGLGWLWLGPWAHKMLDIFLTLASFIFPPNYHCPLPLLQVSRQRHRPVTVCAPGVTQEQEPEKTSYHSYGSQFIRKLKVNLSLEQEVLPGGHWHWSPCPGTASLSRNGCGSPSSWLHFRCARGTLLTDFEGKEQNWQNFPEERAPNRNVQSKFWRRIRNWRSDCQQPAIIPGCTVRSFHFLRGEWFLLIEF